MWTQTGQDVQTLEINYWVCINAEWRCCGLEVQASNVVALSSAEAEFMAASSLVQEVIYIRKLLTNLGFPQVSATEVGEDNRTCIAWSEGSVGGSDRAKHIDLRAHFVHAAVQDKIVSLHNIRSNENVADILTKALPEAAFTILRKQLMGT